MCLSWHEPLNFNLKDSKTTGITSRTSIVLKQKMDSINMVKRKDVVSQCHSCHRGNTITTGALCWKTVSDLQWNDLLRNFGFQEGSIWWCRILIFYNSISTWTYPHLHDLAPAVFHKNHIKSLTHLYPLIYHSCI